MSFLQDSAAKVEAWISERERSGADWADPRRETPQGVLKAPKFVKFHMLDSGATNVLLILDCLVAVPHSYKVRDRKSLGQDHNVFIPGQRRLLRDHRHR